MFILVQFTVRMYIQDFYNDTWHYCQHTIKHGHYVCILKGIAACYSKQSEGKHCMYSYVQAHIRYNNLL